MVLVVWQDTDNRVYAVRVNAQDGSVLDPNPIEVASMDHEDAFAAASDGSNFLVTWINQGVWATRLSEADGVLLDKTEDTQGILVANNPTMTTRAVSVSYSQGMFSIAWSGACETYTIPGYSCPVAGSIVSYPKIGLILQRVSASDGSLPDATAETGGTKVLAGGDHIGPAVSVGGNLGPYVAFWLHVAGSKQPVCASYDAHSWVEVSSSADYQSVASAFDGTQFINIWPQSLMGPLMSNRMRESDETLSDPPVSFCSTAVRGAAFHAAFDGSNFVATWEDTRGGSYLARLRPSDGALLDGTLDAAGNKISNSAVEIAADSTGRVLVVERDSALEFGIDEPRLVAKLVGVDEH